MTQMWNRVRGVAERMAGRVALAHAQRVYRKFEQQCEDIERVQSDVWRSILRRNSDSDFGDRVQLGRSDSISDYRNRVPLQTYETLKPFIDRVREGDTRALLGPRERIHMFATTSGTIHEPKYLPVTTAYLREYRRGWTVFGIKALLDHPRSLFRPLLQVTSRAQESVTPLGIPCGSTSGLMARQQNPIVRRHYVVPPDVADILNREAKYYTIMRLAVPAGIAFSVTASAATQLALAKIADRYRERIIRDVHDGTLCEAFDVQTSVRETLRSTLKPDPQSARRLEQLVESRGALLPRDYWHPEFLANWTGGTMGIYLDQFPYWFGDAPVRDIGLMASEGRISLPIDDNTPAGVLDSAGCFFEFIPRSLADVEQPPTLLAHELKEGEDYVPVITTVAGLFRYRTQDLVRVVGFHRQAPMLVFLNRVEAVSSLMGEQLTEHDVIEDMRVVVKRENFAIENFVLAAARDRYVLYVDIPAPRAEVRRLAIRFDKQMRMTNALYDTLRADSSLDAVRACQLPNGTLESHDEYLGARHRRGNEQYKHRFLYPRTGEDAMLRAHIRRSAPGARLADRDAAPPAPTCASQALDVV